MRYNERTSVLSKTLIFLFIPMYAAIFHVLFFIHRPYFVEHAVVATHLWSFILLLFAVVVPAIALALMWWLKAPSVAANAVALVPVAYEIVRKKKISYESEIKPLAPARSRTDENGSIAELAIDVRCDASGPGNAPRRSRK